MPAKLKDTLCPQKEALTSILPKTLKEPRAFIIAEAGVNHNGNIKLAEKLAKAAKDVKADAVKFQTFWDLGCLKKYEFSRKEWIRLKAYCDKLGIEFMTTPHWGSPLCGYKDEDYGVIDFVDTLVKRHKVASPYLVNEKYLKYIAQKGKPILLSTGSIIHNDGMATLEEIETALNWIPEADIALLHCVSKYPCQNAHLERIKDLDNFKKDVGLSDHSLNIKVKHYPIIEKHFKLDDKCIDAMVSLNPKKFKQMVTNIRTYEYIYCQL